MQRVVHILYWQWTFLFAAVLVIVSLLAPGDLTGFAVLQSEDTTPFAPPYDAFTGSNIISLQHQQVDNDTFHVDIDIDTSNSYVYTDVYYYTSAGWQVKRISTSNDWIKNDANLWVEGAYADVPAREGDDLFVGVWVCKGIADTWYCGCKNQTDCGYWHLQGIDLESEGQTLLPCEDGDGDGYGVNGLENCFFTDQTDCDDDDPAINPGAAEVPYNSLDDDCNASTPDDDLDGDGSLLSSDCDDDDPAIHPLATETCDDGIDQDCSGTDKVCEQCGEGGIPGTGCLCADTSRYTGFCCDNTHQGIPCGTPEVIFYDGFESGTGNTWEYLNPNSRVNTDLPQSGSFSLDLIYSLGSALKTNQYAETSLVEDSHLFHRYFIYFEEDYIHAVNGVDLGTFGNTGWPITQSVRQWQGDITRGRLFISIDGTEYPTDKILQNGQWHCIEEEIITDGAGLGNGIVRVWVDGTQELEETGLIFADGEDMDYLRQGGQYRDTIEDSMHIYVDNVVVSRQQVGCS